MILDPLNVDVREAELMVATSEASDPALCPTVTETLRELRERLQMDVAFVSKFEGGKRTLKVVESRPGLTVFAAGQSDPLEESWCHKVVNDRVPRFIRDTKPLVDGGVLNALDHLDVGTFISVPVVLRDGSVYGTVCCFSMLVNEEISPLEVRRLESTAKLVSMRVDDAAAPPALALVPDQDRENQRKLAGDGRPGRPRREAP